MVSIVVTISGGDLKNVKISLKSQSCWEIDLTGSTALSSLNVRNGVWVMLHYWSKESVKTENS